MRAAILIRTEPAESRDVVKVVRKLEGVEAAFPVFGRADVIARAEVRSYEQLMTLLDEVSRVEGIVATETLPELEVP